MLNQTQLHLFDTGYCVNIEKMVAKSKPFRPQRFYALVGLIEHPQLGPILFDTGYASNLTKLCNRFPYNLYRLTNPIRFDELNSAKNQVKNFGYQPEDIKHIIISHFHPDHISGLKDFKNARFYGCEKSYKDLQALSFLGKLTEMFFSDLLPSNFEQRFKDIKSFPINIDFTPFEKGYDVFGDQSIVAIDLPGHAKGQIGIFLRTPNQTLLLASDACWQSDNYRALDYPHSLTRLVISDYESFKSTLHKLHRLKSINPNVEIIPTHCIDIWDKYVNKEVKC